MHWKSFDYRITSLMLILVLLENAIDLLFYKLKENDWYDGLFLMEEREPIYGLAFIALQQDKRKCKDFTVTYLRIQDK